MTLQQTIWTIVASIGSATLGGLGTYLATVLKIRQELGAQYDSDLRHDRIIAYKELWKCLEPLARYAPPGDFTYAGAHKLAVTLRSWYFETGGLFLSEEARDAYFAVQKALTTLEKTSAETVPEATLEKLRSTGSALRTKLSEDVGTRARGILQDK
jgi:hypothetical protein